MHPCSPCREVASPLVAHVIGSGPCSEQLFGYVFLVESAHGAQNGSCGNRHVTEIEYH